MTSGPDREIAAAEAVFAQWGRRLIEAIEVALPGWIETQVLRIATAWGEPVGPDLRAEAAKAGAAARAELGPALAALLTADVDEQASTPLELVRGTVRHPTAVLAAAGVAPVVRDPMKERAFPADIYDLSPATWADVDPALHEPGLAWGAAKAFLVLRRHRETGG